MSDKYKNKYRIESTRLRIWDYGWDGAYFVTVCTHNRINFFGKISDDKMQFSEIGQIIEKYWNEIPNHFPFANLEAFVVMPNHIHGIVMIDKNKNNNLFVETPNLGVSVNTAGKNNIWKSGTLGVIINQYKRICTINSRKINPKFGWQSRFYEHIIRNETEYNRIVQYIINNPLEWKKDKLNPDSGNMIKEPNASYGDEIWMI